MVTGRKLRILSMNRIYFCFVIRIRDSVPDPNGVIRSLPYYGRQSYIAFDGRQALDILHSGPDTIFPRCA